MDARRFDALIRDVSAFGPRRRLLGALAVLPILGILLAGEDAPETLAKDRRRRRKQRHRRRHDQRGSKAAQCRKKSVSKICAGRCGAIKSKRSCGKAVDCSAACTDSGSMCCDGACQTQAQLNAACPSSGTPGFLTFEDGTMRCGSDAVPACACLMSVLGGVYRACAPSTVCKANGAGIVCNYLDSQAPETALSGT